MHDGKRVGVNYSFSPMIDDLEHENPLFKEIARLAITPMLTTLSVLNHVKVNSEAEMISVTPIDS